MDLIGYALLLISCSSSGYECDSKPITQHIYSTRSECEWELSNQTFYYSKDHLICAEVRR